MSPPALHGATQTRTAPLPGASLLSWGRPGRAGQQRCSRGRVPAPPRLPCSSPPADSLRAPARPRGDLLPSHSLTVSALRQTCREGDEPLPGAADRQPLPPYPPPPAPSLSAPQVSADE
eukprot:765168-Hanusia_phi.AAC.2